MSRMGFPVPMTIPVAGSRSSQCQMPSSSSLAFAILSCPESKSLMYLWPNPLPDRALLSIINASTGRPSWNHKRLVVLNFTLESLDDTSSQLRCTSRCCLTGKSIIRGGVGGSGDGVTVVGVPDVYRSSDVRGESDGKSRSSRGVGLGPPPC